jgi:hypothetical protein
MPRVQMLELFNILSTQEDLNWHDVSRRVDNKGPKCREFALQKAGKAMASHAAALPQNSAFSVVPRAVDPDALPIEAPSEQQGAPDVPVQGQDIPAVNLVLLQAAYIQYVEETVHEALRKQAAETEHHATGNLEGGCAPQQPGSSGDAPVQEPVAALGQQPCEAPFAIWDKDSKSGGLSRQAVDLLEAAGLDIRKDIFAKAPAKGTYHAKEIRKNLPTGIHSISIKGGELDCVEVFNAVQACGGVEVRSILIPCG